MPRDPPGGLSKRVFAIPELTFREFAAFLQAQPDLSPKAWPRYVWATRGDDALPVTATNKVIKRQLSAQGLAVPHGVLWERLGRSADYARSGPTLD